MRSLILIIVILAGGFAAAEFAFPGPEQDNNIVAETRIEAFFCPFNDCVMILTKALNSATTSLDCAFFDLSHPTIINVLEELDNNVNLALVIDKKNYDNEITVKNLMLAEPKQYMHNKFCIIDQKIVITGSANPTKNGLEKNNNNLVMIRSSTIVENYLDEFDELQQGVYGSGKQTEQPAILQGPGYLKNYFCPEDNCKQHVLEELAEANNSIYFMTFSFTDKDIANQLISSSADVKGVIEARSTGGPYAQYSRLQAFNIPVKKDSNKQSMHHKVFIIDNSTVITGSYNPTASGNTKNDENILIIRNKNVANKFAEEFFRVWY